MVRIRLLSFSQASVPHKSRHGVLKWSPSSGAFYKTHCKGQKKLRNYSNSGVWPDRSEWSKWKWLKEKDAGKLFRKTAHSSHLFMLIWQTFPGKIPEFHGKCDTATEKHLQRYNCPAFTIHTIYAIYTIYTIHTIYTIYTIQDVGA